MIQSNAATCACTRTAPSMEGMSVDALEHVAAYFQVLSEPTRLQILNLLRGGERNVGEIARLCGYTAANVSRHLALLTQHGFVARASRGTAVYYRVADPSVYQLCDLVCGNIGRQLGDVARKQRVFELAAAPRRVSRKR